ncbi:MAG: hypothetical protein EXR69_11425 [Myxococcales bacterium]|nr:hypothetical protein [Myxococcales bacterium]
MVLFLLGLALDGWVAGIIPATLALGIVYVLLARRTGKQVEAIFLRAMGMLQAGDVEGGRTAFKSALGLGKWQFLVSEQVHGQLGQLDYQQACGSLIEYKYTRDTGKRALGEAKLREAIEGLEKSWSRDWRSQAVRAICLHRLNRFDEVPKVLRKAEGGGASEPLFWGTWAWLLNEQKKRDEALQVVGRGLSAIAQSKPLLALREAFSNKRRPDMTVFGEAWYALMPDEIPKERLMEMAQKQQRQGANNAPAAGAPAGPQSRAQRRGTPPKPWQR